VRERELKLAVGDTFVLPDLADATIGVAEVRPLAQLELGSVYHDTADLRLARHGVTLRYRIGEEGGPGWTLKLPVAGADGTQREELTYAGSPAEIPPEARQLVAVWVRHAYLAPAAALTTKRRRWLLVGDDDDPVAELDLDEVSVIDGERVVARFRELELESRGPELEALIPITRRLQAAGATPAPPVPKAVRALGPRATAGPDVAMPTGERAATVRDVVRAALAAGITRLRAHDTPTRLGGMEGVHQMRVATRRLRSDLRTFHSELDPAWADGLIGELRWLGRLLGAVRDTDVELAALREQAADLQPAVVPLLDTIAARGEAARAQLLEALASARYVDLVDRLIEAARQPLVLDRSADRGEKRLHKLLLRPVRGLDERAAQTAVDAPEPALHAVRIAAKQARYAAEAIGPHLRRSKRIARIAREAAALQDLLGRLQDAAVLRADVEEQLATREGDSAFALVAGRLIERGERVRGEVRAAYPEASAATRTAIRRWLNAA